jgi:hypothetical protein
MSRLAAVVCALVLALSLRVDGLAAPDPQPALAPGSVVALAGTPHVWIADAAGDPRIAYGAEHWVTGY